MINFKFLTLILASIWLPTISSIPSKLQTNIGRKYDNNYKLYLKNIEFESMINDEINSIDNISNSQEQYDDFMSSNSLVSEDGDYHTEQVKVAANESIQINESLSQLEISIDELEASLLNSNFNLFDQQQVLNLFNNFKIAYNKSYATADEAKRRFKIFEENLRLVRNSLINFTESKSKFAYGLNEFSDLSDDELSVLRFGLRRPTKSSSDDTSTTTTTVATTTSSDVPTTTQDLTTETTTQSTTTSTTTTTSKPTCDAECNEFKGQLVPRTIDWRRTNCVLAPVNQGQCGACYAFAVLSVLESMQCLWRRRLPRRLSPQQLVDCVRTNVTNGCNGGWPGEILDYYAHNTTLASRASCYHYKAASNDKCKLDSVIEEARRSRYTNGCITRASPTNTQIRYRELHAYRQMMHYVAFNGPIVVAMEATPSFQRYSKGIFDESKCRPGSAEYINHAVTIVGYGTDRGHDYWLIKNSWGQKWGTKGYGRILRGINACSIESVAWTVLQ